MSTINIWLPRRQFPHLYSSFVCMNIDENSVICGAEAMLHKEANLHARHNSRRGSTEMGIAFVFDEGADSDLRNALDQFHECLVILRQDWQPASLPTSTDDVRIWIPRALYAEIMATADLLGLTWNEIDSSSTLMTRNEAKQHAVGNVPNAPDGPGRAHDFYFGQGDEHLAIHTLIKAMEDRSITLNP